MKLDLRNKLDSAMVKGELQDYLAETESGKRWLYEMYSLTRQKSYLHHFLELALADIQVPVSYYRTGDLWRCIVMSIEYLREVFKIKIPVEVVQDITKKEPHGPNFTSDFVYSFAFDDYCELLCSEIVVHSRFVNSSGEYLSQPDLIGILAHEVWHAHQIDRAIEFLQRENGIINLETLDPTDFANRGALYYLSNVVLYVSDSGDAAHRYQISEAEAIYLQDQIKSYLIG